MRDKENTPPPPKSTRKSLWRRVANDERGLSTLEWILLVAAVGGLATAGVIIVRNAVGGAGDQVDDEARTERLAQDDTNKAIRTSPSGAIVSDGDITYHMLNGTNNQKNRCDINYQLDDGTYPMRKWRGSFTLRMVQEVETTPGSPSDAQKGGSGKAKMVHWCDAVPTNNLANNSADIAGPIRTNYTDAVTCVRWPDGVGINPNTNKRATSCD